MAEWKINFDSSVLEGHVKFREKKTWKRRWCVLRRLSPVANSLIMELYKKPLIKSKDCNTKSSINIENLLGIESCFLLQKESQTLAIICKSVLIVLAFENRETLLEWQSRISDVLGQGEKYEVQLLSVPSKFEINSRMATLHIRDWQFSLTQGAPPRLLGFWNMADLRRFGAVDDRRFCFEGGSRCSFKGAEGLFVLGSNKSHEIGSKFEFAVRGRLSDSQRIRTHPTSPPCGLLTPITRHRLSVNSRASQSMSKPSTPLLSSHRKASELCLSPPCTRHFRTSASQQHSRASSISSVVKISAMQSDPELLYDKPRSLNATMTQATLEATHPADHYDTPRRVLQGLNPPSTPTRYLQNGKEIRQISRDITEQKSGKCESAPISVEVEGYLLMQRKQDHRQEYVEMQPLSQTKQDKSLVVADPPEKKSIRPCSLLKTDRTDENWANQLYQNSVWLQLQVEGANETYQNPVTFRSLYPKCGGGGGGHGTLPHIHSKNNSQIHGVNLRLRRSASMPCRQGNRDSSDSTDSGVSVTADLPQSGSLTNSSGYSHQIISRHWSLPRPTHPQSAVGRLLPWPNTSLSSNSSAATNVTRHSSNSSNISNILDQLETLSVNSVGYETCV